MRALSLFLSSSPSPSAVGLVLLLGGLNRAGLGLAWHRRRRDSDVGLIYAAGALIIPG